MVTARDGWQLPEDHLKAFERRARRVQPTAASGRRRSALAGLGIGEIDEAVLGKLRDRARHLRGRPGPAHRRAARRRAGAILAPSADTMRSRPGRSVTSMRPSGRKVRPQGWSSPRATVSTMISAFSVLRRCGCCARAGREANATATQAKTEWRNMADSQLTPHSSAKRPDQEINNLIQQRLGHASVAATGACCTSGHLQLSSLPRARAALIRSARRRLTTVSAPRSTSGRSGTGLASRDPFQLGHGHRDLPSSVLRRARPGSDALSGRRCRSQPTCRCQSLATGAPSNRRVRTDAGRNRGGRSWASWASILKAKNGLCRAVSPGEEGALADPRGRVGRRTHGGFGR